MPEGPEVETIRRGLELGITGQQIRRVHIIFNPTFAVAPDIIHQWVEGAMVRHVDRRGKVLILELSTGYALLCHLKMTGQLVFVKADGERYAGGHPTISMASELPDKSTRVVFEMADGDNLFFNDQRKFGWIKLVFKNEINRDSFISRLGLEVNDPNFTSDYLISQFRRRARSPVKAVLLDQSVIAGVGNIYADESLNLARIHPAQLAGDLSAVQVTSLQAAIREIIALGVEHGGTSFSHYVNSLGGKGDYLEHVRVYHRQGKPCPVCGTLVIKVRVAGRGTHLCPHCQRLTK